MSDVKTIEQAPIEQTPQPIPEMVQKQYDHLVETIRAYNPGADFAQIDAAFRYAAAHHGTQKRKDGSPFVTHPIAVAQIVAEELHLDSESIIAALLHDCIEDTDATYDDIAKRFSPTVADLVEGVSKLTRVHYTSKEEEQMENLRKMLMAMAKDIRVILIKIADRTHNMRTMEYQSTDKQRQKSLETMEIYAPIAHRLGMQRMKWELEDLSLKYLDPTAFNEITHSLEEKSKEYGSFMESIQKEIEGKLTEDHIPFRRVYGRMKHPYSIYRKMYAQSKTMDEVFDLFAFRVIVDTVADCYNVLGVIHDLYRPVLGRFKDYIGTPKPNGYQSLHTTVMGPDGVMFEVQIRTQEMHDIAEYGIAAPDDMNAVEAPRVDIKGAGDKHAAALSPKLAATSTHCPPRRCPRPTRTIRKTRSSPSPSPARRPAPASCPLRAARPAAVRPAAAERAGSRSSSPSSRAAAAPGMKAASRSQAARPSRKRSAPRRMTPVCL